MYIKINISIFHTLHDKALPLDREANKFLKRVFDIIFSFFIIVFFLSWIIPLLALAIKLTSKGPVLFSQKRTGINNKAFMCWKLRSMYVNDEAHTQQATHNDPRITPVGKIMRKFSLDEIPQFFNVFIGNMSVVGPRPHMLSHTLEYSKVIDGYMKRCFVKPGITGLSQVMGYRGEIRNHSMIKNRIRLDTFYLERWRFVMDLTIVLKTIKLMLFGDKKA